MEKYLRRYAEPEVAALEAIPEQGSWANVLVIPACNESPGFLRPPPPCDGRSLMVLVINESESASHKVSLSNEALANSVRGQFEPLWHSGPDYAGFELSLFRDPLVQRDILLVDRFNGGRKLPIKGGVGHARKIGADLAACLIHHKHVLSPWIHCSDGDTQLPDTYFACSNTFVDSNEVYSALVYPYHHCDDLNRAESKAVILATQLYELSLRYYVAGMKYAGSPYAFHTIGSTMAVRASHYAKVRGFPKREAGEDFYLLNKLAKVGSVMEFTASHDCEPIEIEARRSDRVPFGTGAAVNKITALADQEADFRFYDPMVFELVRLWLQALPVIWQSRSSDLPNDIFPAGPEHQLLLKSLQEMGTQKALEHAFRQSKDLHQFEKQMHTWFDAFRTLKLIHVLRDGLLASVGLATLESNMLFRHLLSQDPDLSAFIAQWRVNIAEFN